MIEFETDYSDIAVPGLGTKLKIWHRKDDHKLFKGYIHVGFDTGKLQFLVDTQSLDFLKFYSLDEAMNFVRNFYDRRSK